MESEPDESDESSEGLLRVREDDLCGFKDSSGTYVVKPLFDDAGKFSSGLARVMNHQQLWGYINTEGSIQISFQFDDARDFVNAGVSNR